MWKLTVMNFIFEEQCITFWVIENFRLGKSRLITVAWKKTEKMSKCFVFSKFSSLWSLFLNLGMVDQPLSFQWEFNIMFRIWICGLTEPLITMIISTTKNVSIIFFFSIPDFFKNKNKTKIIFASLIKFLPIDTEKQ